MYGRKMSSPSDDADEPMHDPLADELRNIESVIIVTRRNIDALNEKFANLQEPPAMYIVEYQELTQKLHELETKKCELTERVRQSESPEPPEDSSEVREFFAGTPPLWSSCNENRGECHGQLDGVVVTFTFTSANRPSTVHLWRLCVWQCPEGQGNGLSSRSLRLYDAY